MGAGVAEEAGDRVEVFVQRVGRVAPFWAGEGEGDGNLGDLLGIGCAGCVGGISRGIGRVWLDFFLLNTARGTVFRPESLCFEVLDGVASGFLTRAFLG